MVKKSISDYMRSIQGMRKARRGGFTDPKVRAIAMKKSLETRRKNKAAQADVLPEE